MPDYLRIYAKQEYLTPGAAKTVDLIAENVQPSESAVLVDVAAGKGEAACTLAGRFACRVLAVDLFDPYVHYAAAKAWHWNLRDLVTVVRGDGRRLPIRDGSCDAAYCIGAPSIVGLEQCLAELARVTRPNGHVIVSDVVWREVPEARLGPEWGWLADLPPVTLDEYVRLIADQRLTTPEVETFGVEDWEEYWRPMREVAAEARTGDVADPFFADDVEQDLDLERRAVERYLDYVAFVARKPER